jgi:CheY-like chemotaxis protein
VSGEECRIVVIDTGVGIPADYLDDIFSEFFQVPSVEGARSPGLGLGLSIVKRTADLLGHRVDVRSWLGRGSCFEIVVPRSIRPVAAFTPANARGPDELAGTFVLVLDDDEDNRTATKVLLEEWRCHCVAGASAEEVIAQLQGHLRQPDAIVCDLELGEHQSGVDAIARLRNAVDAEIPALIVTGDVAANATAFGGQAAITVLHKPVGASALRRAVALALVHTRPIG